MRERIFSILLAVALFFASVAPSFAASPDIDGHIFGEGDTIDEALQNIDQLSIHVAHKLGDLDWMTLKGTVRTQWYTYFLYNNDRTGTKDEHPVYCIDPDLYGAPKAGILPNGEESLRYHVSERVGDPYYLSVLENGYPHQSLASLGAMTSGYGVPSEEEAYYATKMALWAYILNAKASDLGINPAYGNSDQAANRVLNLARFIFDRGMTVGGGGIVNPTLTLTPDKASPYPDPSGQYYKQIVTVKSTEWVGDTPGALGEFELSWEYPDTVPAGTIVQTADGTDITGTMRVRAEQSGSHNFNAQVTLLYPKDAVDGAGLSVSPQLNARALAAGKNIFVAYYNDDSTGMSYQRYLVEADPKQPLAASLISPFSGEVDYPMGLRILKVESGTGIPLEGAVFRVLDPDGRVISVSATDGNGLIDLELGRVGNYTVTEVSPPAGYLPSAVQTQSIYINYNEVGAVTFENDAHGSLRIEKRDENNGNGLRGAVIQTKNILTGVTMSKTTDASGVVTFTELVPGAYEIRELTAPEGYVPDPTVHTANVLPLGQGVTNFALIDKAKPGLRIVKLDRQSMRPVPNVTFAVHKGAALYGEYATDQNGEIFLPDLEPDTYTVKEIAVPPGLVPDPTTQWVTLAAGDGIARLMFLNDETPGIWLIKVDSETLLPLPNATFLIERVGGGYAKEFTTGLDGEIELTNEENLDPGAYTVTETAAPSGYLIDDAVRTVQTNGGENARFVFTDTKKPSLEIVKYDAQNALRIAGATFRIAKIEDGTRYLDRVTDANGGIVIDGLDPGVYSVSETAAPGGYALNEREYLVELFPGKTSRLVVENVKKPSLIVRKHDLDTALPLPGAEFSVVKKDNTFTHENVTNGEGFIRLDNLEPGWYTVTEIAPPPGYLLTGPASKDVYLKAGETAEVKFDDLPCPTLTINKIDKDTSEPLAGVNFNVKYAPNVSFDGGVTDLGAFATNDVGQIVMNDGLKAGWYRATEIAPPPGYVYGGPASQDIFLGGGDDRVLTFENVRKPSLIIRKYDLQTTETLPNAEFSIRKKDGPVVYEGVTDEEGEIALSDLEPGYYTITEIAPPPGYLPASPASRDAYLEAGKTLEVKFDNLKRPTLTINKLDSVTKDPIKNARFNVRFSPNANFTGGVVDLGNFATDAGGRIVLGDGLESGWYRATEIEPAHGYTMKEPAAQDIFLKGGENKVLTFENIPKSALVIGKIDNETGVPVSGATFSVKYLAGTSGSGGTTIFEGVTGINGTIVLTALAPGTYVVEETKAAPGYELSNPSVQTAYIAGEDQDVVTLSFGNARMGTLLIKKLDSATKRPIKDVTFRVTDSSGAAIGPNGGEYTTDAEGLINIAEPLPAGSTVIAQEIRCPDEYVIDTAEQSVKIKENTTHTLTFYNTPKSGLLIVKIDSVTKQPLKGAEFTVYGQSGDTVGNYETDGNGSIAIPTLDPGRYRIVETRAPEGYLLDDTPKDAEILANRHVKVVFGNRPLSGLLIKKYDAATHMPLPGAVFKVTTGDGTVLGSANGEYVGDKDGAVLIPGLVPDTYVVTETKAPDGYLPSGAPQTIKIADERLYTLEFENEPRPGLQILKLDEETRLPIAGVEFSVSEANGKILGNHRTDDKGLIFLPNLAPGRYTATETKSAPGYLPDESPRNIELEAGKTAVLTVTNRRASSLTIRKTDSVTGKGIYGVTFILYDADGNPLMQLVTDQSGYAYPDTDLPDGRYRIRELEPAEGYEADDELKTVFVEYGKTSFVEWKNKPITAQIQIVKHSLDHNPVTGVPAGSPLKGAVFEVTKARSGAVVCYVTSDARGVAATEPLPLGRYFVTEVTAPPFYRISGERHDVELEYPGQIIRISAYDKSAELGTTIKKRGNAEVMAGDVMRYDFSDMANASNVPLSDFYWLDRLPTDAARAVTLVTGTYSQRVYYRILYKTAYGDYRVLARDLLGTNNYSFDLTDGVLGLAPGEAVTEIKFEFGTVEAGFASVAKPMLFVATPANLPNGYQIVNRCEVGGKYQGAPQVSTAAWLTKVLRLGPAPGLPKTGY